MHFKEKNKRKCTAQKMRPGQTELACKYVIQQAIMLNQLKLRQKLTKKLH